MIDVLIYILFFQFPITSPPSSSTPAITTTTHFQHTKLPAKIQTDNLRLQYVTERILSSVLPARNPEDEPLFAEDIPGFEDKYERELIEMLEHKHGKVCYNFKIFI